MNAGKILTNTLLLKHRVEGVLPGHLLHATFYLLRSLTEHLSSHVSAELCLAPGSKPRETRSGEDRAGDRTLIGGDKWGLQV